MARFVKPLPSSMVSDRAGMQESPRIASTQTNKPQHDGCQATHDEYNWYNPKAQGNAVQLNCHIGNEKSSALTTRASVYNYLKPEASDSCREVNGKMTEEAFKYWSSPGGKKGE
ncbi:hypothetical protein MMC18_001974 [Xylographa bjoerkii]|nr:hypothetical protein [Xylographa bjoerkii]